MSLLAELKRRNVIRVGLAYLVLGWVIIQVTDIVAPALMLPEWTLRLVIWIGIIGFPFALVFAWAFEVTPEGIKRESEVDRSQSSPESSRRAAAAALDAARERLRLLGVPDNELARMEEADRPTRAVAIRSPFAGTVIERLATEGAGPWDNGDDRCQPGILDLSDGPATNNGKKPLSASHMQSSIFYDLGNH